MLVYMRFFKSGRKHAPSAGVAPGLSGHVFIMAASLLTPATSSAHVVGLQLNLDAEGEHAAARYANGGPVGADWYFGNGSRPQAFVLWMSKMHV